MSHPPAPGRPSQAHNQDQVRGEDEPQILSGRAALLQMAGTRG